MYQPSRVFLLFIAVILSPAAVAVDGDFDSTWAGGGRIAFAADFHNPGSWSEAHRVTVHANGYLLLSGLAQNPHEVPSWWLGELTPMGVPVPTFGESNGTGLVTGCWLSVQLCGSAYLAGQYLQDDGRIAVVSGPLLSRTSAGANALDNAGVVTGTGIVDTGWWVNDVQGQMTLASALVPVSEKWLAAGYGKYSAADTRTNMVIVRLNPDFSLDTTFNATTDEQGVTFAGGQVIAFGEADDSVAFALFVHDDGHIYLLGNTMPSIFSQTISGAVARLNADGTIDATFGEGGKMTYPQCGFFGNGSFQDRADRILATCVGDGMKVMRLLGDGVADATFGAAGVATVAPPDIECSGGTSSLRGALDSAGRIVLVGICKSVLDNDSDGQPDPDKFIVARLHGDDGSLDTSFGSNGFAYGRFSDGSAGDGAEGVVFDGSGRPIINGYTTSGTPAVHKAAIARLTYDLIFTNDLESVPRGRLPGQ